MTETIKLNSLKNFLNDKQVQELQSKLEVVKKEQSQSFNIFKTIFARSFRLQYW